jgi:IS30 family transposase
MTRDLFSDGIELYSELTAHFRLSQLISKSRRSDLVRERRRIVRMLHDRGWGVTEIGRLLNRDHSTIIYLLDTSDDSES